MKKNRDAELNIRCTEDEKKRYQRKAKAQHLSLSEWVRRSLDEKPVPQQRSDISTAVIAQRLARTLRLARLEARRTGQTKIEHLIEQAVQSAAELGQ